jgi:hypothetical protein
MEIIVLSRGPSTSDPEDVAKLGLMGRPIEVNLVTRWFKLPWIGRLAVWYLRRFALEQPSPSYAGVTCVSGEIWYKECEEEEKMKIVAGHAI